MKSYFQPRVNIKKNVITTLANPQTVIHWYTDPKTHLSVSIFANDSFQLPINSLSANFPVKRTRPASPPTSETPRNLATHECPPRIRPITVYSIYSRTTQSANREREESSRPRELCKRAGARASVRDDASSRPEQQGEKSNTPRRPRYYCFSSIPGWLLALRRGR